MFNLIFVDDESIIRSGISKCIKWEQNGFNLVGMFENGQDAYEYVSGNKVDVVITDINMPLMDGLALSRLLYENFPNIIVLLLSGYDDFEYAQKAVKNHVREFLLKPITASELEDALKLVNNELVLIRDKEKKQTDLENNLENIFPLIKERFFNRLITGQLTKSNYCRRKEYYKWHDLEHLYQISYIKIPEKWKNIERLEYKKYIMDLIDEYDEVFYNSNEDIIILFQGETKDLLRTKIDLHLKKIFKNSINFNKKRVSIGCGSIINNYNQISYSYTESETVVNCCLVLAEPMVLSINCVLESKKIDLEVFDSILNRVLENLNDGRKEDSLKSVYDIFTYMKKYFITHKEALLLYARIHHSLSVFKQNMGFEYDDDYFLKHPLTQIKSIDEAHIIFSEYIDILESHIDKRRNDIVLSRIDRAKKIISLKYDDFNFSLQDICNELYLSVSQFSLVFKEGTGETFVEYLTHYRIEEAKKLLKMSNNKVYEIASRVGYQDPRYFSIIFKKVTGATALEYRKRFEG